MLVLVTHREDLTADWLILELADRGVEWVRLNTEDWPNHISLSWSEESAELRQHERRIVDSAIDAVWWRRPLAPRLPLDRPEREALWAAGEAQTAMEGFWRGVRARWINHPSANVLADCKPEQLRRARSLGFLVPPTLVTNAADDLHLFAAKHGQLICKSLRNGQVPDGEEERLWFTTPITAGGLADLSDFGPEPYLFQALVPKRYDVRVTVVGETAYACAIRSQDVSGGQVDWRNADADILPHEVEDLPPAVAERCVGLTRSYGLLYSAIDLARRPDGEYAFFELNPNGQWAWIEQLTGLPLRAALTDELLGAL